MWFFSEAHPLCKVKLWTLIDWSHNKRDLQDVNLAIVEPNLPWSFPLDDISYLKCPIKYLSKQTWSNSLSFSKVQNIPKAVLNLIWEDLCVGPVGHINISPQTRAWRCDNLIPEPSNVYVDNRGLIKKPNERFYEICTHVRTFVINNDPQRSCSYGKSTLAENFPIPLLMIRISGSGKPTRF